MASPENQHCASCIGTLSFPISNCYVICDRCLQNCQDGQSTLEGHRPSTEDDSISCSAAVTWDVLSQAASESTQLVSRHDGAEGGRRRGVVERQRRLAARLHSTSPVGTAAGRHTESTHCADDTVPPPRRVDSVAQSRDRHSRRDVTRIVQRDVIVTSSAEGAR